MLLQFSATSAATARDIHHATTNRQFSEIDAAWVENDNDFRWIGDKEKLVWLSERDGWRHIYLVGEKTTQLTKGAFDVVHIEAIDEKGGWIYCLASPDNPTQRYLYRVSLKGDSIERITPAGQPGTHSYSISADAQWALHTHSSFTRPPVTTLIHLQDHTVVTTIADNVPLREEAGCTAFGTV
ncbi:MAG: DPP IV N-terminal domain-containing protein [Planctomycetes bacterium]|nr:DPP IV N-terminal domain-containing protein [Planctomycetota bacterium]